MFKNPLKTLSVFSHGNGCEISTKFISSEALVFFPNFANLQRFSFILSLLQWLPKFPFLSFSVSNIHFSIFFYLPFAFYLILFIQPCLPHSIRVTTPATALSHSQHASSQRVQARPPHRKYNVLDYLRWVQDFPDNNANELVSPMLFKAS